MILNRISSRPIALAAVFFLTLIPGIGFGTWEFSTATAQQQRECPVRVTLLQVNDVYQFAPVDGGARGGLARVLALRKQIMSESPHGLYPVAGATITPSGQSNMYQGRQRNDARKA